MVCNLMVNFRSNLIRFCLLCAAFSHTTALNAAPGDLLGSTANPNANPNSFDYFGYAITNLSTSFVVGCYNDDPNGVTDAGSVYQFDSTTFNLLRKINNPVPQSGAQFGKSVATVGANFAVATAFDNVDDSIYLFDGTSGALLRTITPPAGKFFGGVSSDAIRLTEAQGRLLVQGFNNVMAFDAASGDLVLDIPRQGADSYFGQALAERGNDIVVAGLRNIYVYNASGSLLSTIPSPINAQLTSMTVTDAGHIFAAYRDGNAYLFDGASYQPLLTIHDPTSDHTFCCNVAAVGGYLIVGNKGFNGSEGIAYIFDGETGQLVRTVHNPSGGGSASSGEYFGETIVPFKNNFMIGVMQADLATPSSRDAGAVYLFEGYSVPEPGSLALAALLPPFLLRFRRRQ